MWSLLGTQEYIWECFYCNLTPLPSYQTKIINSELSIWSMSSMMNHLLNPFGSVTRYSPLTFQSLNDLTKMENRIHLTLVEAERCDPSQSRAVAHLWTAGAPWRLSISNLSLNLNLCVEKLSWGREIKSAAVPSVVLDRILSK